MKSTKHAVLAVDPGGTTGIAAAYFTVKPTLKETLLGLENRKSVEIKGGWLEQGREIGKIIGNFGFTAHVENFIPMDHIHVVFEDFVLRRLEAGGATGNLTSIWVAAASVACYCGSPVAIDPVIGIDWQMPSQAKTLATNDRLKLWGLWEVGSAHKRDAWRHVALRVNRVLGVE